VKIPQLGFAAPRRYLDRIVFCVSSGCALTGRDGHCNGVVEHIDEMWRDLTSPSIFISAYLLKIAASVNNRSAKLALVYAAYFCQSSLFDESAKSHTDLITNPNGFCPLNARDE